MFVKSLLLSLLFASAAFAQSYSAWEKVDTVTSGNSSDFNPVLDHGGFGGNGPKGPLNSQWLVFDRQTPCGCNVVAKLFLNRQVEWDTTEYVLSSEVPAGEILHADVASISDTIALAVWQQLAGGRPCIYFSKWNGVVWTDAHAITSDTMDESQPKVRVWSGYDAGIGFEVKFILGWVQDSSVVFTTYSDSGFGQFQTVAKSNYDSTQFDVLPRYYSAGLIWTIRNRDGSKTLCARFVQPFPPFGLTHPDTLQFHGEVIDPHFATDLGISVLFDSKVDRRWIPYNAYTTEPYNDTSSHWLDLTAFIGSDSTSDILCPQYWSWPMIIDGLGKSDRGFSTTYFPRGWPICERIADHDTSLVFGDYYYSDTVVTSG